MSINIETNFSNSSSALFQRQPRISEALSTVQSYNSGKNGNRINYLIFGIEMSLFLLGGKKSEQITNAVGFMIAKDNLPLNTTEKEGFKYLLKTVAPLYKPLGRKSISNLIKVYYDSRNGIVRDPHC